MQEEERPTEEGASRRRTSTETAGMLHLQIFTAPSSVPQAGVMNLRRFPLSMFLPATTAATPSFASMYKLFQTRSLRSRFGAATMAALLLLLAACKSGSGDQEQAPVVETPPSLRADVPGIERVRLNDTQERELRIETVPVVRRDARYELSLPGEVMPAPENFALVSAPISGRVVRIHAHEGERVRRGQVLLELESLEFANLAAEYLQAVADETYQQTQVERLQTLVERKISPRSTLDKASADLNRAQTSVSATYARLKAVGVADEIISSWSVTSRERPLLQIYAPISGVIDRHEIDLGQSVTSYQELMSLLDISRVLVRGFVSPDDAPYIAPGDTVRIANRLDETDPLVTRIATINPALDETNKSVVVNVLTATRDGWPIPGQNVRLQISAGNPKPAVTLPLSAVQYEGQRAAVFVQLDPLTYEKRFIEIDRMNEDAVIVASGLNEGEQVAVNQVFSLKALSRFEMYGEE